MSKCFFSLKSTIRYAILYFLPFITIGQSMAQLTNNEKSLINSETKNIPFRVLLTDNENDSLFLRTKCIDISNYDIKNNAKDLRLLIDRMICTMDAESGVGLAAPQIGIGRNVFIFSRIDIPEHPVCVAINPKIIDHPSETICFEGDGCLSIPNVRGNSIRYPWVEVEYTDLEGNIIRERLEGYSRGDNFTGIIFQHEFDHLQGVLFIDKLCEKDK